MLRTTASFLVFMLFASTAHGQMSTQTALHLAIDEVLEAYPEATVGVSIRDLTSGAFDRLPERSFHAASTMKVPVVVEVFRQAETGRFALSDSLVVRNTFQSIVDGSSYEIEDDSDTTLYARLGEPVPIRTLVDRMITHSSNLATNLLIEHVTPDSVRQMLDGLDIHGLRVLRGVEDIKAYRQGLSNSTTAPALADLLFALAEGRAVSPTADRAIVEVLLDQAFNSMIPSGLPDDVHVAHKTGWITRIHHDAAIVYPPTGGAYVLVILTEGVEEHARSSRLGAEIARAVHTILRGSTR